MPRPTSPQLQLLIERLERDARHWRKTIPALHADTRRTGRYPTTTTTHSGGGNVANPTLNHALAPDRVAAHMTAIIAAIIRIDGLAAFIDRTLTELGTPPPPEPKCGGCSRPLPLTNGAARCDTCRKHDSRHPKPPPP